LKAKESEAKAKELQAHIERVQTENENQIRSIHEKHEQELHEMKASLESQMKNKVDEMRQANEDRKKELDLELNQLKQELARAQNQKPVVKKQKGAPWWQQIVAPVLSSVLPFALGKLF